MAYEAFVGLRYLMSQRRNDVLSVITLISIAGVAVGVMALIVVLSVMGGFEGDLKTKILGTRTHIVIMAPEEGTLRDIPPLVSAVEGVPSVVGISPFVESEVMISSPTNLAGVVIRGIDPARIGTVSDLERNLVDGDLGYLDSAVRVRPGRRGLSDPDELDRILDELEFELELAPDPASPGRYVPGVEGRVYETPDGKTVIDQGASEGFVRRFVTQKGDAPKGLPPGAPSGLGLGGEASPAPSGDVAALYGDEPEDGFMPPLPGQEASPGGLGYDPQDVGDLYSDAPGDGFMPPLPGQEEEAVRPTQPLPPAREIPGIIIGKELKKTLQVDIGSEVNLVSPQGDVGPSGPIPRSRPFRVVGVFYSGMYEYDTRYVYLSIPAAQGFLNLGEDEVTGIEVKTADVERVKETKGEIVRALGPVRELETLQIQDWEDLNSNLFAALKLEKIVMWFVLGIIILVASFSIVCILIMKVIEKAREIAILKSMGASDGGIMRIFIFEGAMIGVMGTVLGTILGVSLCLVIEFYGIQLDSDVYYIANLPVEMKLEEIARIAAAGVLCSVLATLYPAWQAARMSPVEGLRYE